MRTVTIEKTIYKFGDFEEIDDKIRDYFHQYGCFDWFLQERIDTLKKLAEYVNGTLDYSISVVPDRGEYISISNFDADKARGLVAEKDECPLTGMCYDYDILSHLEETNNMPWALQNYLEDIHREYEYLLSDEHLKEHCEANGYEFDEDGNLF